jgi:hypothetical protein
MIPGPTGDRCLLCGRGPANDNAPDPDPLIVALMTEPPGPIPSIRAGPDLATGEISSSGPKPRVAPEIERLARQGWTSKEIVEEGRRRKADGQGGWSQSRAYEVVATLR